MKRCYFCAELMRDEAVVCSHCRRRQELGPSPRADSTRELRGETKDTQCTHCGARVEEGSNFCMSCGTALSAGAPAVSRPRPSGRPQQQARRVHEVHEQLYYPPKSDGTGQIVLGCLFPLLGLFLIPEGLRRRKAAQEKRQHVMGATGSVLMSRAEYVGGHPLMPHSRTVILSLTATQLTIYSIDDQHAIQPEASIPLTDIAQSGIGRPKTAEEVYSRDSGYSIDVYERSPFLRVEFRLRGDTYCASFEQFESDAPPHMWYNQIAALKYQLRSR